MLDRAAISQLPTSELDQLGIRTASLSDEAVMLMGYQRTMQISNESEAAWSRGDSAPLAKEVRERKAEIVEGTLKEVWREYLPLREYLRENNIAPGHVADIGCGAGLNDLFLAAEFNARFTLIDIETTEQQYHGWAASGSGYASLASARGLLEENAVPSTAIETINPTVDPDRIDAIAPDLVTSLYSCGFHYPVDEYLPLFEATLARGGAVVLDIRKRFWANKRPGIERLCAAGAATEIFRDARSVRVAFKG